jgi:hypothetical protein
MDQNPPPPPPPSAPPPPSYGPSGAGARPGVVTAAAVLLFIAGGFSLLGALILFTATAVAAGFVLLAIVLAGVGAIEIYAGVQVLNLKERGRILGIVLASIGLVLQLLSIGRATGSSIIGICIDAFIIWALVTNAQYFTP